MDKEGIWGVWYSNAQLGLSGFGMVCLETGLVVGADYIGGSWDGEYVYDDKKEVFDIHLTISMQNDPIIPPGDTAINTLSGQTMQKGYSESFDITMPNTFDTQEFTIPTSMGDMNIMMKKIRDWPT